MIDDPLVKTLLTNVVEDESNLPIVQALIDGVETDEEIANKTGIKLNIVRKILYKLYDMGLASYKRSKDPETQWFTYTWRFEKEEYIEEITKFYEHRLNERQSALDNLENNLYFVCCMEPEHFKGDYAESSEFEFYCPVCDYELEPYDAKKEKSLLKRRITIDKKNFKKFEEAVNE